MTIVPPIPITVRVNPNSKFVKFVPSFASAHGIMANTSSASIHCSAVSVYRLQPPERNGK
jgi:hypothetical protein